MCLFGLLCMCLGRIGRWPDGPPQSGVAQGLNLIPVSGGVCEAVGDERKKEEAGSKSNKDMTNDEMTIEAHRETSNP